MREPQFSTDDAHSDRFYTALAGQLLMKKQPNTLWSIK